MLFLYAKKKLIVCVLSVFTLFYFIYAGISSQYLIWILPFAFLAEDRYMRYFSVFGTFALVSFYSLYHPYIVFGRFGQFPPVSYPSSFALIMEALSLSLFWVFCILWTVSLLRKEGDRHLEGLI